MEFKAFDYTLWAVQSAGDHNKFVTLNFLHPSPQERAMLPVPIDEAQAHLPELIDGLSPGEEVLITRGETPVAKLIGQAPVGKRRVPGSMKGKLIVVEEDDEHLKDFAEYM